MIVLVALSLVTFIGVASTVGIRLLLRFREQGDAPQLYVGLGFLFIGGLGYPATVASGMGAGAVADVALPAWALGTIFTNLGVVFLLAFTRAAFRPRARWAGALVTVAALVLGTAALGSIHALRQAPAGIPSFEVAAPWNATLQLACVLGFGWTTAEALARWAKSRRRLAIGLATRELTNRFLLWAIFGAGTCAISAINALVQLSGTNPASSVLVHVTMVPLVIASSGAIWLAFVPPDWYLERLRGGELDVAFG